jgi:hypothetical protein
MANIVRRRVQGMFFCALSPYMLVPSFLHPPVRRLQILSSTRTRKVRVQIERPPGRAARGGTPRRQGHPHGSLVGTRCLVDPRTARQGLETWTDTSLGNWLFLLKAAFLLPKWVRTFSPGHVAWIESRVLQVCLFPMH